MLLLGATTAFCGEGSRMLQLSDLFLSSAFLDATQEGKRVPVSSPLPSSQLAHSCLIDHQQVLSALADNAKTNQHGRVDEHSTLRHCLVELDRKSVV